MNKIFLTALFSIAIFAGYASAAADCTANPVDPDTGLMDCGIDFDSDSDGSFETHYSSLSDFIANGFPNNINAGDTVSFRIWLNNTLAVPAQDNTAYCYLRQFASPDRMFRVNFLDFGIPSLTLNSGETGYIQADLLFDDILYLNGSVENAIVCVSYNEQQTPISKGARYGGLTLDPNIGPEVELLNPNIPADNCPAGSPSEYCANMGDSIQIEHQIRNNSSSPLGPFNLGYDIGYGQPLNNKLLGWKVSQFQEGTDTVAPGATATFRGTRSINFLEGDSRMFSDLELDIGGRESEINLERSYVVSGPAYVFTRLSPFSIYNLSGSDLKVSYRIEPEPEAPPKAAVPPQQLYIVAEIRGESDPNWQEAHRWNYMWSGTGDMDQTLSGFDISPFLTVGKKHLRLQAFDSGFPVPMPDPLTSPFLTPGPSYPSYDESLLDWTTTTFSIPRMLQPEEEAFFPEASTYTLPEGNFKLGLRNLSDVSSLLGPPTVDYGISLASGNQARITNVDIGCDSSIEHASWQDISSVSFSSVLPEQTFAGPSFGGDAPGLNQEICMSIGGGSFRFAMQASNDVAGTSLDESSLYEELDLSVSGCGDGIIALPEECEQDSDCASGPCLLDCTCGNANDITSCGYTISSPGTYTIAQNLFHTGPENCIEIDSDNVTLDGQGFTITGDSTPGSVGIKFINPHSSVTIQNCIVHDFGYGIRLEGSSNNTLLNNEANGNTEAGIVLDSSSNNTLSGNTTSGNGSESGLNIYNGSNGNQVTNHTANNNSVEGIKLSDSHNNTFQVLEASGNTGRGAVVGGTIDPPANNSFSQVTANSNGIGFLILDGSNTQLSDSTLSENTSFDFSVIFDARPTFSSDHTLTNVTGSGGRPIAYYHDAAVNLSGQAFSELVLCNADNSVLDNITVDGSDSIGNNGLLVVRTDNSSFDNIVSSDNQVGIYLIDNSSGNSFNNSVTNNNYRGVYSRTAQSNAFDSLQASGNNYGIHFYSTTGGSVQDSAINGNMRGAYIENSSGIAISDTAFNSNSMDGVTLINSSNNTFSDIEASHNSHMGSDTGFNLQNSTNNAFSDVKSNYNDIGISLDNSPNNSFNDTSFCYSTTEDISCTSSDPQATFSGCGCDSQSGCGAWASCSACPRACSLSSVVPDPVLAGNSAVASISYSGFSNIPTQDILRCGTGSGATPANFSCAGLPVGTCTFDCLNFSVPGSYADVFAQITDGVATVDCGALPITVNASAGPSSGPDFYIEFFEIDPNRVVFESPGSQAIEPVARVTNRGADGQATLWVKVFDSEGTEMFSTSFAKDILSSNSEEFSSAVGDAIAFDAESDWNPGIYSVQASVYDSGGTLHDNSNLYLHIGLKQVPVPENSPLLLPLVGFSVLALIFLSSRKNSFIP